MCTHFNFSEHKSPEKKHVSVTPATNGLTGSEVNVCKIIITLFCWPMSKSLNVRQKIRSKQCL